MSSIILVTDNEKRILPFASGESVFDVLVKNRVDIGAPCAGRGMCGKCGAVISAAPKPSKEDERFFSADELAAGVRLCCRVKAEDGMTVSPLNTEKNMNIEIPAADIGKSACSQLILAVDIGTTTLALALADSGGRIISTAAGINPQRIYGADVISRIAAASEGKNNGLTSAVREELLGKIGELIRSADKNAVSSVVISANTAMCHLLLGLDCSGLGVYPFKNCGTDTRVGSFKDVFGSGLLSCDVTVMGGISTFVGADIVSGMYYCDMDISEDLCLFIDLGTNAEMAIGKKGAFTVASAAAGPAFEGGNILFGTGSIPGAVCSAEAVNGSIAFKTIDNAPVSGICGTGVIETAAALLKAGLMDETGALDESIAENGLEIENGVRFTAKDVRELQLAKSAVRAGIETLLAKYGADAGEVKHLFLSGGFGSVLNPQKAADIGLIPKELVKKTVAVGNSSLKGAVKYASFKDDKRINGIIKSAKEAELAKEPVFSRAFMEHMFF